jgi:hypothetical protein
VKQIDYVVDAMEKNNGYATFGQLYKILGSVMQTWGTKTPQASIRRIVQTNNAFFRIEPGLWALTKYKQILLHKFNINLNAGAKSNTEFTHSYYQGIVVEIGNIKRLKTYVPPQDKNHLFLEKPLNEITGIHDIYNFTYPEILKRAKTIDVIWFNERRLPHSFFEIEHTTDIQNSLSKFFELQDYFCRFYIVASDYRKKQFKELLTRSMYKSIASRIKFASYESIVKEYTKLCELSSITDAI